MIIKMKNGDLLNTDHIVRLNKYSDGGKIMFSTGRDFRITENEYNELLENLYP